MNVLIHFHDPLEEDATDLEADWPFPPAMGMEVEVEVGRWLVELRIDKAVIKCGEPPAAEAWASMTGRMCTRCGVTADLVMDHQCSIE